MRVTLPQVPPPERKTVTTETPLVSVVMSVHNHAPYLLRSVGSVLGQTIDAFELVIVNDGSTDDTQGLLESFDDDRLRVVRQETRGAPLAVARGMSLARGRYVARLDAVDRSSPERLQRQADFLQAHQDHVAVGSWWRAKDAAGRLMGEHRCPVSDLALRWRMLFDIGFPSSSMMIRRAALDGVEGWEDGCGAAHDYDLLTRLAGVGRISAIPEFLTDWQLDAPAGAEAVSEDAERESALRVSRREIRRLLGDTEVSEDDVDALWRLVTRPEEVCPEATPRAVRSLRILGRSFVDAHGEEGGREVVDAAFRDYGRSLLGADLPDRRVGRARIAAAARLAPRTLLSMEAIRAFARSLVFEEPVS